MLFRSCGPLFRLTLLAERHAGRKATPSRFNSEQLDAMRSRDEPGIDIGEPLTLGNLLRSPRSHKQVHPYKNYYVPIL
jgi:hypothetical protein